MRKLVGLQAQATQYFATVQMMAEDVRPELDKLWEEGVKARYRGQTVKQKGFRPRAVTQADVEEGNLLPAYQDYWHTQLINGVRDKIKQRVAFATEFAVLKQGNMFIVNAVIWLQPDVQVPPTFMKDLADCFLKDEPVSDEDV